MAFAFRFSTHPLPLFGSLSKSEHAPDYYVSIKFAQCGIIRLFSMPDELAY
jgi:hypothetical protein